MRVLVTGAGGFVGQNLCVRLEEQGHECLAFSHRVGLEELADMVACADAVVHLAGVNRASSSAEYNAGNNIFTRKLCEILSRQNRPIPVIASSSRHAVLETDYGRTKRESEKHLEEFSAATLSPVAIYRLPNVFGKWSRPDYNSVVATFCHNIARDLPIVVDNPDAPLRLVHIDDVIDAWMSWLANPVAGLSWPDVNQAYNTTVGDLAVAIKGFRAIREMQAVGDVGIGLTRALYATYISYLSPEHFSYSLQQNTDRRGVFVEMLRTQTSGQFSYFTALPGITRGGHYHHSKTEKFLVLRGNARFCFRNIVSQETYVLETSGENPLVVETIPGWAHDITNIGADELIVMLWANELFDRMRPDTISSEVLA